MKKSLSMMAVCAIAMGANAADKSYDMLGRQNNTANYVKKVETTAVKEDNVQQNKLAFLKAQKAVYGNLTMGEYDYAVGEGKLYSVDETDLSEDEYVSWADYEMSDYIRDISEGQYNDYVNWDSVSWYYRSPFSVSGKSYVDASTIFRKSNFVAGNDAETIHLLSDGYGCLGSAKVYPTNWNKSSNNDNISSACLGASHSSAVALLLSTASTGGVISSLNNYSGFDSKANHFYPMPFSHNIPVGLATGRFVSGGLEKVCTNDSLCHDLANEIDEYVYKYRVTEIAGAGNNGASGNMTEYGRGLNVITVGSVSPSGVIETTSSNKNPMTDVSPYDKPEILNYSNFSFSKDRNLKLAGTEGAAAYTAAMVARLMKTHPFYRWHPEVVKALLLTSSTIPVTSATDYTASKLNKKILKGVPDFSVMKGLNRSKYWYGPNKAIDKFGRITFQEDNIVAGKTYRIAIAWLVNPKSVKTRIPMEFDLTVSQVNGNNVSSKYKNATFQYLEFVARNSNPICVNIFRGRDDAENDDIILGYNLYQVR